MTALLVALAIQEISIDPVWIGHDGPKKSKIAEREFHRILDQDSWKKLWARHAGEDVEVPKVDFEQSMVVAGLFGPKGGIGRMQVLAGETKEQLTVRFGTHVGCGGARGASPVSTFFFVKLPRSKLKLVVQECDGAEGGLFVNPKLAEEFPAIKK